MITRHFFRIVINTGLVFFLLFIPRFGLSQVDMSTVQSLRLLEKANETGFVRVIVRLNKTTIDSDKSTESQESASSPLELAQNRILSELATISAANPKSVKKFEVFPGMALEVDSMGLHALANDPSVVRIEEDIPVPPLLKQSIPLIDADDAWALGYSGSGQTVAILDTGVDKNHPFLDAGKVVSEACYSTTSGSSTHSLCPDGVSSSTSSGAAIACSGLAAGVSACSHGTHVAGIAAGQLGSTGGVSFNGVAPNAKIIAVQVFSRFDDTDTCDGEPPCLLSYTSDQIRGLERIYALRNTYSIASANMSIGGEQHFSECDDSSIKSIIDLLREKAIATVISSGNDGYDSSTSSPGCVSSAITVGSSTKSDAESDFSNHASWVDLMAPGSSIESSVAPGTGYDFYSGTSMAAPHVTGAWAIMKSKNGIASVSSIEYALESSGVNVTVGSGSSSKPRIDLDAALAKINPGPSIGLNWDHCREVYRAIGDYRTWCYLDKAALWIWINDNEGERSFIQATTNNHWVGYYVNSIDGSSFTINHVRVFKN